MRFAAIVLTAGFVGTFFAANVQGTSLSGSAGVADLSVLSSDEIDTSTTGSTAADGQQAEALRLIDLRTGQTCKTDLTRPATGAFTDAPLGEACRRSPSLSRVAYWRESPDGTLIMADQSGDTVLTFMPGDGVLYESIFPADVLITIVPARS